MLTDGNYIYLGEHFAMYVYNCQVTLIYLKPT